MTQIFQEGDRVKLTRHTWHFNSKQKITTEKVGTFLRYSNGLMYTSKLVIKFDDNVKNTYISKSSNVIKI